MESDLKLLRTMLLIRRFEEALSAHPECGFQLFSSGQEAVAVGVCAVLGEDDQLLSGGRSIAAALARGLDPSEVMAELIGRTSGPCQGRAGRGHLAEPAKGFFGAHAVVGGNLSIAAGVALQRQMAGKGLVACIFGDGACGSGALHETLNIAALWRLPLLFVCDNNGFSVSTRAEEALAVRKLSDLAAPFGIPARTVDGMDMPEVRAAAAEFAEHVRSGAGPAFLECRSQRFFSHSSLTKDTRTAAELEQIRALCPIDRLAARLRASGGLDAEALGSLDADVTAEVAEAMRRAEAAPRPSPDEVLDHVL